MDPTLSPFCRITMITPIVRLIDFLITINDILCYTGPVRANFKNKIANAIWTRKMQSELISIKISTSDRRLSGNLSMAVNMAYT